MYGHAYSNVSNERSAARQCGAAADIGTGSLSPHRALILAPPPPPPPPPAPPPLSKTVTRTWIMCTHWSADWELLFKALGHYWRRDYPTLVPCMCMGECITQLLVTAHTPRRLAATTPTCTLRHAHMQQPAQTTWPKWVDALIAFSLQLCSHCLLSSILLIQTEFNNYCFI